MIAASSDGGVRGERAGAGAVLEAVYLYPLAPMPAERFVKEIRSQFGDEEAWELANRLPATQVGVSTEPLAMGIIP